MKGMTTKQFAEVVAFVQKHHRFALTLETDKIVRKGETWCLGIKYIDSVYDTRDQSIWCVKFRGWSKLCFATNHFNPIRPAPDFFKYDNLFDWIMDFLKGDWYNEQILKQLYQEKF